MKLVIGYDDAVLEWLAKAHGVYAHRTPRVVLGIAREYQLAGAFVVTWHCDRTAELGVYGHVSHGTVKHMFRLVFGELGVYRLEARTSRRNRMFRKAAPKFGFRYEGTAKSYYGPNDDALCFALLASECRWLKRHEPIQKP